MPAGRAWAARIVAVVGLLTALVHPAAAQAAGPSWNGRYTVVTYASQKAGTSVAARQPEADFSAVYTFATDCWTTKCVATVVDGPAPTNPTLSKVQRYTWDGTQWMYVYDWQWECFRGDGAPKTFNSARSWVIYVPQPDGSLRGTWHTDISDGTCRGNVIFPIGAYPAP